MNSKQEVLENIYMADEYMGHMFPHIQKLEMIITGGSSFLLKGLKNKFTLDIDSITELDDDVKDFLESFAINNHAIEVTKLPTGYKERMVHFKSKCKILDLYLLSNEDLVLAKIGRCSSDDVADIVNTGILDYTDIGKLTQLAEQLCAENKFFISKWSYFKKTILGEMVA
jgi:hypothetical protein